MVGIGQRLVFIVQAVAFVAWATASSSVTHTLSLPDLLHRTRTLTKRSEADDVHEAIVDVVGDLNDDTLLALLFPALADLVVKNVDERVDGCVVGVKLYKSHPSLQAVSATVAALSRHWHVLTLVEILESKGLVHEATQSLVVRAFKGEEAVASSNTQDIAHERRLGDCGQVARAFRERRESRSASAQTLTLVGAVYHDSLECRVRGKGEGLSAGQQA